MTRIPQNIVELCTGPTKNIVTNLPLKVNNVQFYIEPNTKILQYKINTIFIKLFIFVKIAKKNCS